MITLKLLHPLQSTPIQVWSFDQESVIRIGRSTDNQVVLYSAVVSRNHVELRYTNRQWELVNLGSNGTYVDGQRVSHIPVKDGMIIRLARSGPHIQIQLDASTPGSRLPKASVAAVTSSDVPPVGGAEMGRDEGDQTRPGPTHLPPTALPPDPLAHAPSSWRKRFSTT
ncbi:FHA domain-containing protein, partial [Trichothermofontia sp.]